MDFAQYITELQAALLQMENSPDYLLKYQVYPPAYVEDMADMETEIAAEDGMEGFKIWEPMRQFYQVANGFSFGWQYLAHQDSSRITCGTGRIKSIYAIYEPEEEIGQPFKLLYEQYRLFDWIGIEDHVSMKFSQGKAEPDLYYYTSKTASYHVMAINFSEYLRLLLQTRGLYPWQAFFLADKSFTINTSRAEQFLMDLQLLFPEVDRSQFSIP